MRIMAKICVVALAVQALRLHFCRFEKVYDSCPWERGKRTERGKRGRERERRGDRVNGANASTSGEKGKRWWAWVTENPYLYLCA